ncbi:MAG: hypothetical protein ACI93R_003587 [Flavobacteriales bacterium]|jgi:hypothetical protein
MQDLYMFQLLIFLATLTSKTLDLGSTLPSNSYKCNDPGRLGCTS